MSSQSAPTIPPVAQEQVQSKDAQWQRQLLFAVSCLQHQPQRHLHNHGKTECVRGETSLALLAFLGPETAGVAEPGHSHCRAHASASCAPGPPSYCRYIHCRFCCLSCKVNMNVVEDELAVQNCCSWTVMWSCFQCCTAAHRLQNLEWDPHSREHPVWWGPCWLCYSFVPACIIHRHLQRCAIAGLRAYPRAQMG